METLLWLLGLAWILTAWCGAALGIQCAKNQYPLLSAQGSKCCNPCETVEEDNPCPGVIDPDCKCTTAGYKCIDRDCSSCLRVPNCKKGEKLTRSGNIRYSYECQPCPDGEYSDTENGFCKNWTDCASQYLKTIEPGNQTHDAICGNVSVIKTAPDPRSEVRSPPVCVLGIKENNVEAQGSQTTILALLTAVAIFILILGSIFLHLYIWRMKNEKLFIVKGGTSPTEPENIHPLEETWSCQLPEEEHGEKILEEVSVKQSWQA